MRRPIPLGILFSRSGDYALLSRTSHDGAMAGIEAVNADPRRTIRFEPQERDPGSRADAYGPLCAELLQIGGLRHIVGCVTSSSRKEVIPLMERHEAMLWYAAPYEGFEANERVIYTHACPNQHIVPLLNYALPRHGREVFLLGSNYVWGWENNRVAREIVGAWNGRILGERFLPVGDGDVSRIIAEIRATRPTLIVNNMIGQSSYALLRALAELGREDPAFRPDRCPVLSCDLMETELPALAGAAEGHLVVGPYFADGQPPRSSMEAAAHASVLVLADLIEAADSADPAALRRFIGTRVHQTPLGRLQIDARTQHSHLPVLVGRITGNRFVPVWQSREPIAPDPYLSHHDARGPLAERPLRVVS